MFYNENNKRSMEDKRTEVMKILQDYFNRPTPLDKATDSILRLFSVVRQSEQLFCPKCGRHERIIGCSVYDYLCDDCGNVWAK